MPPNSVHFNGSVNLADAETVMREVATRIPVGLRRVTDGETGERIGWVGFQIAKFMAMTEFESVGKPPVDGQEVSAPSQLHLAPGVAAENIAWPDLGYAKNYVESYGVFVSLRDQGVIPAGTRFQMQYPTPRAAIGSRFPPEDAVAVWRSYEAALFGDLGRAIEQLPHHDIAVQWDVAIEITFLGAKELDGEATTGIVPEHRMLLETLYALNPSRDELVADVARCVHQVPADVPVGLHLCYGDYGHRHAVQPLSLRVQVEFMNALASKAPRTVNWAAFTVPQDRSDDAYFAPLRNLDIETDTELNFGIVPYHPSAQAPGTTADQVALIDRYLGESAAGARSWGVCQECGLGRVRDAEEILGLLDLHREILEQHGERRIDEHRVRG
jgi:hypothetical protein